MRWRPIFRSLKVNLISLIILSVPLLFAPVAFAAFEPVKLMALRLFSYLLFGILLFEFMGKEGVSWKESPVNLPILAFLAWSFLASLLALVPHQGFFGDLYRYEGFFTLANYFFLFYVAYNLGPEERVAVRMTNTFLITVLAASIYGILQHFGFDFLRWNTSMMDTSRSFSTFGNAVFFGNFLALAVPISLSAFILERGKTAVFLKGLVFYAAAAALIFTYSRGAWLGAAAGCLAALLCLAGEFRKNNAAKVIIFIGLVLIAVVAALSPEKAGERARSRLGETLEFESGSAGDRLLLWEAALNIISDNPVLGTGPDTFRLSFPLHRPDNWYKVVSEESPPDKAHNEYLQLASGSGLMGLLLYIWIVLLLLYYGFTLGRRNNPLAGAIAAGLTGMLVSQFFSFSLLSFSAVFWLLAGLLMSLSGSYSEKRLKVPGKTVVKSLFLLGFPAALVFAVLNVTAFMADTYLQKAYTATMKNDFKTAAAEIEKGVRLNGNESKYYLRLGDSYLNQFMMTRTAAYRKQAEKALSKAGELNPYDARVEFYLGNIYIEHGGQSSSNELDQAANNFNRILELDPNNRDAHFYLGLLYDKSGNSYDAATEFKNTIVLDPGFASAYFMLGKSLESAGSLESAKSVYEEGLRNAGKVDILVQAMQEIEGKLKEAKKNDINQPSPHQ